MGSDLRQANCERPFAGVLSWVLGGGFAVEILPGEARELMAGTQLT